MPTVLLAASALLPEGEYGGEHLLSALAERDVTARWVAWDDPAVDWSAADLVAVRSTWDYHRRLPEFLAWAPPFNTFIIGSGSSRSPPSLTQR